MTAASERPPRSDRSRALVLLVTLVAVMWAMEIADLVAGDLDAHGIEPRDPDGLPGVVFAPFLHAGFGHLIGNTIPFLILGAAIALSGLARTAAVVVIVALVAGLGTWLFGGGGVHVGASGIVFGFATYLMTRGLFSRRMVHLGVGVLVLAVYGTTLLAGLVPTPGVSGSGHFFGAAGGVVAGFALHGRDAAEDAT